MNLNPKLQILSSKISPIGFNSIVDFYLHCIENKKKGTINYANIHTINIAEKNEDIKYILNSFDITHPDGIGIWLISKMLKLSPEFERFNWTDYAFDFLQLCQNNKWKIFFLGGKSDIISRAVKRMNLKFPGLRITGFHNGFENLDHPDLIAIINKSSPDIIWVGLGVPKQEEWILRNKDLINVYVLQAVGDVFSHLAGEKMRGPILAQRLGFEWLFRIIDKPKLYFKRYFLAFWKILWLFLTHQIKRIIRF